MPFENILFFISILFSLSSYAVEPTIPTNTLRREIEKKRSDVLEFDVIKKEAERLGVRVWLFGGTAATFAHYVKNDLQHKKGDDRFLTDRFDYSFGKIFRGTQDLDIVVDGPNDKIEQLEQMAQKSFPYLQGNKSAWEFRPLRQNRGTKSALLNSPEFLNQHSDSQSTGLIELTSHPTEKTVRDLRDWESANPRFLEDVRGNKITFLDSEKHKNTNRFKSGQNPEIFSVIRFLIKVFQFDLTVLPKDIEKITEIISRFEPKQDLANSYASDWFRRNAIKLYTNTSDLERTVDTLKLLGLTEVFKNFDKLAMGSLSWWAQKEPLRSFPIGTGSGRTARDLNITELAHETSTIDIFEGIQRSPRGRPNIFISRSGSIGEAAVFGDGFYTMSGRQGARGTNLTVRLLLQPDAREGTDFKSLGNGYTLVLNRSAVTIAPDNFHLTPVQLFDSIDHIDNTDFGLFERSLRTAAGGFRYLGEKQKVQIANRINKTLQSGREAPLLETVVGYLSNNPLNQKQVEIVGQAIDGAKDRTRALNIYFNLRRQQSETSSTDDITAFSPPAGSVEKDWMAHYLVFLTHHLMDEKAPSRTKESSLTLFTELADHSESTREWVKIQKESAKKKFGWSDSELNILLQHLATPLRYTVPTCEKQYSKLTRTNSDPFAPNTMVVNPPQKPTARSLPGIVVGVGTAALVLAIPIAVTTIAHFKEQEERRKMEEKNSARNRQKEDEIRLALGDLYNCAGCRKLFERFGQEKDLGIVANGFDIVALMRKYKHLGENADYILSMFDLIKKNDKNFRVSTSYTFVPLLKILANCAGSPSHLVNEFTHIHQLQEMTGEYEFSEILQLMAKSNDFSHHHFQKFIERYTFFQGTTGQKQYVPSYAERNWAAELAIATLPVDNWSGSGEKIKNDLKLADRFLGMNAAQAHDFAVMRSLGDEKTYTVLSENAPATFFAMKTMGYSNFVTIREFIEVLPDEIRTIPPTLSEAEQFRVQYNGAIKDGKTAKEAAGIAYRHQLEQKKSKPKPKSVEPMK